MKLHKMRWFVCISLFSGLLLTSCGKQKLDVTIVDGNIETRMQVEQGATVAQALCEAEIQVTDNDRVDLENDFCLTEQDSVITIERYAKVLIKDGEQNTEVECFGETVEELLKQNHIVLGKHDYINHDMRAFLKDGMEIQVVRRMEVFVDVDGEITSYLTQAHDVEGVLAEQNIHIDEKDRISPKRTKKVSEGCTIKIKRVSVKEIVEKEDVDFDTQIEYSNTMYTDQSSEKKAGVKGEKEVRYQVTYVDGKEEKRKAVSEKVTKEPVSQIIVQGTKKRRTIVSRENVPDCDGSGHGYYVITWSDGTVEYQDY